MGRGQTSTETFHPHAWQEQKPLFSLSLCFCYELKLNFTGKCRTATTTAANLCQHPLSLTRLKFPITHSQALNELLDVPFTNNTTQSLSVDGAGRPLPACRLWRAAVGRLRAPLKKDMKAGFFCRRKQTETTAILSTAEGNRTSR